MSKARNLASASNRQTRFSATDTEVKSQTTLSRNNDFFNRHVIGKLNSRPDEITFIPNLTITLLALLASIIFEWSKLDFWIKNPTL